MIKLHSSGIAPYYTEYGRVTTDCNTVGQFMTEAAAIYGGELTIKVDGCRYELSNNPKIMVTDDTPIDEITYASIPGRMTFIVKTKPKPKTVRKSGWVNIWRSEMDGMTYCGENIFENKTFAERIGKDCDNNIATVKIEWEEVVK